MYFGLVCFEAVPMVIPDPQKEQKILAFLISEGDMHITVPKSATFATLGPSREHFLCISAIIDCATPASSGGQLPLVEIVATGTANFIEPFFLGLLFFVTLGILLLICRMDDGDVCLERAWVILRKRVLRNKNMVCASVGDFAQESIAQ